MISRHASVVACISVALSPIACNGDNGSISDGGNEAHADGPGASCDISVDPKDSPACVADSFGIFVDAANGQDSNAGTKEAPVKTIGAALGKVGSLTRVYVCEGTYLEDLLLDASHDGVSLYGGWKCSDWSYSGGKPFVGVTQLAAKLDSLTKPVTISDIEFDAANGDATKVTSTAMLINASNNVTLERVKLLAATGHDGAAGTLISYTFPDQTTLNGKSTSGSTGAVANPVTCPGGQTTTGGKGGDNGFNGDNGMPSLGGGAGGILGQSCAGTGSGGDGTGATAAANATAITKLGVLSASDWSGSSGAKGQDGSPGQGGGGGQGAGGGGGGGGGAGGCGGASGSGGAGGGASIALTVVSSTVIVNVSTLTATTAGNGGAGAAGQAGETLFGFHGNGTGTGCQGGNGGAGGAGGAGAGGAGGISVGVLWSGSAAPTLDSTTTSSITVASSGGTKGTGGAAGQNDGIPGVAQAILQAP